MFLRFTFLSSKSRKKLFLDNPPRRIYLFCSRVECGKNGEFLGKKAVDYIWAVWEKGYKGETILKWVN